MTSVKRFIHHVSLNSIQLFINQGLGLLVFYLLSCNLDKTTFGNFNWALAVLLTSFGILAFGIDQLAVKKIAGGEDKSATTSLFICHVVITGVIFLATITLLYFLFPDIAGMNLLLLLTIGKFFGFLSMPFKQLCIGLEKFRSLLFMSVVSSIVKAGILIPGYIFSSLSLQAIVAISIVADFIELIVAVLVARKYVKLSFPLKVRLSGYKTLIKESLPQFGTIIFAVLMARADWILIGLFLLSSNLAEYSFAYKIFELSTLPLLIVGPILIPQFSKIFKAEKVEASKINNLKLLLTIELIIASLTSLVLAITWSPLVDYITDGNYGAVNQRTIFILSMSIPLLYFNNFLWTIHFCQSRLKMILQCFALMFLINVTSNIILIPILKNEGAAISNLISIFFQSMFFLTKTKIAGLKNLAMLFIIPVAALLCGAISNYTFTSTQSILAAAICLYALIVFIILRLSFLKYKPAANGFVKQMIRQPMLR